MPKTRLAAPVAILALAVAGCGSSDDGATTDPPEVAAATATAPSQTTAPATTTTTPAATTSKPAATTPTTTSTTSATPGSIRGSNGKMYRCIGPNLLSDLKALNRRIDRGRTSLRRIRRELRRIKGRYPSKVAPQRVAQRYNYLVRKHNALLRLGNRRVRAYNGRLERDCTRG